MRKQLLGVFLPLFIVTFMVAAETGTTGTATLAQAASKHASGIATAAPRTLPCFRATTRRMPDS